MRYTLKGGSGRRLNCWLRRFDDLTILPDPERKRCATEQADGADRERQPVPALKQRRFINVEIGPSFLHLRAVEETVRVEVLVGDRPELALDHLQLARPL